MVRKKKTTKKPLASLGLPKLIRENRIAARAIHLGTQDDEALRKRLRRKTQDLNPSEVVSILKAYYESDWPIDSGANQHFKTLRGTLTAEELVKIDQLATTVLFNRLTTGRPKLIREQRSQARRISLGSDDEESLRKEIRTGTNNLNESQAVEILSNFYNHEWPSNVVALEHIKLLRGSLMESELKRFKAIMKG